MKKILCAVMIAMAAACGNAGHEAKQHEASAYNEPYRPQIHFSPKEHWMNDPNGMVYHNGTYHLFFQYNPDSSVWGPMHWGHATSTDLTHWAAQPIALYPDSLGMIFSGSAVLDTNNTSGFGTNGRAPLVAIFTHDDPLRSKAGRVDVETQSLAYSLDEGKTWTKYAGNPVLQNPGIRDFRDPKVSWFEAGRKWVMTLATSDHITFYSSPDLKSWKKESEFGKTLGAHGGVWECPDLFALDHNGRPVWVLVVNLNPGGPNGGSATQYFTGTFDGSTFTTDQKETKWLDYGPDEYAGITWSNTGSRKVFLGWMSNWLYAKVVPTEKWRSAMTIPRDLGIAPAGSSFLVTSRPAQELDKLAEKPVVLENTAAAEVDLTQKTGKLKGPARIDLSSDKLTSFTLTLSNKAGEKVDIGYDKASGKYFIDRSKSGNVSFGKGFAARHTAPRFSQDAGFDMTLVIDDASVELFADKGLSVMTEIFFATAPMTNIVIRSGDGMILKSLSYRNLKSIW